MYKLVSLSALFFAATATQADVIISVNPVTQSTSLGQQVNVDLTIAGLDNAVSVGTFDLNVAFDPSVFSFSGVNFGNQLDLFGLGDVQSVTPGSESANLFELSLESISDLNSMQAPAFRLATLIFNTLNVVSDSPITISLNALGDAAGDPIAATFQNGAISVSAVPVPSAVWLLGSVLGGGLGFRCRRVASAFHGLKSQSARPHRD